MEVGIKMKRILFHMKNILLSPVHKIISHGSFFFHGRRFRFFIHWYNHTWDNCRRYEIPVFLYYFNKVFAGQRILEVGNVINHYRAVYDHVVVDKYERSLGVINEDIIDYRPEKKFDVVLSCSTLEHVGFDEPLKDPLGFKKAVDNIMVNVLKPGGVLICSVPIGYNPGLDRVLEEGLVVFDDVVEYSDADWRIIIGSLRSSYM